MLDLRKDVALSIYGWWYGNGMASSKNLFPVNVMAILFRNENKHRLTTDINRIRESL